MMTKTKCGGQRKRSTMKRTIHRRRENWLTKPLSWWLAVISQAHSFTYLRTTSAAKTRHGHNALRPTTKPNVTSQASFFLLIDDIRVAAVQTVNDYRPPEVQSLTCLHKLRVRWPIWRHFPRDARRLSSRIRTSINSAAIMYIRGEMVRYATLSGRCWWDLVKSIKTWVRRPSLDGLLVQLPLHWTSLLLHLPVMVTGRLAAVAHYVV